MPTKYTAIIIVKHCYYIFLLLILLSFFFTESKSCEFLACQTPLLSTPRASLGI